MKKTLLILLLILFSYNYSFAQSNYSYSTSISQQASGAGPGTNLINNGAAFHVLVWTTSGGTFSACQVQIDSSADGISWTPAGVLASQACTSNNTATSLSVVVNYVRINVTSLTVATGSPFINVVAYGYVNNPTPGGGGSGTVGNCAAAGNTFYAGSGTTTSCDTKIVDNTGTLNFTQGSIATSQPWINHTATWNAGAVAFSNIFSNITCTAAAAASKAFDIQVGSVSIFSIGFSATNCGGPVFIIPDGAVATASLRFASDTAGMGLYRNGTNDWAWGTGSLSYFRIKSGTGAQLASNGSFAWSSSTQATAAADTCIDRQGVAVVRADGNTACNDGLGSYQAAKYLTTANCASSAGTCAAASSGSVSIAAAATTVTVATTAVTANSVIIVAEDSSLGTKLGVTCNTTIARTYSVTARTAATSFVITTSAAPTTNPACLNYWIIN